ncbi:hypothetical protein HDA30_001919 [Micrococcus cohnii]|uniref:DUF559 domain-containing protein n=1 Tax=Micrococcus cohnii TaxID=993416 RepID=A0A7W7M469_9MICC|nr:hypothetical protein [Micrococcus cohnii]MBB4736411.1 hypothetical protein [Micrococcus cohnii]
MPRPRPLPDHLLGSAFTTAELTATGLPAGRVRAADLERVCRGVHVPVGCHPQEERSVVAAVARLVGGAISHVTAARLWGMPLPLRLEQDPRLHLSVDRARRSHTSALPGVMVHRRPVPDADVVTVGGYLVTTVERTWRDVAALLRPHELEHLVAAADWAVQPRWTPSGRRPALTSVALLRRGVERSRRFVGRAMCRQALGLARVGADSPPETFVRLALVDAGLPEPDLQVSLDPADPWAPRVDLAYPQWRLAIQYDGAAHRDADQQARDARRDGYGQERGWMTLRVTSADRADGYARVIRAVRRRADEFIVA